MAAPVPPQDAPPPVLVRLEQVEHLYQGRIRILGPVDLEIREGEFLSLVGPSGCGKSTLTMLIAGLMRPTSGVIAVAGRAVTRPQTELGIVFQNKPLPMRV